MRFLARAFAAIILALVYSVPLHAEPLTLADYLDQVKNENKEVKGALDSAAGTAQRSKEGSLVTSWNVFADAALSSDARLPQIAIFAYDKLVSQNFDLGVKKVTSFGLEAKFYYNVTLTNYINAVFPTIPGLGAAPTYYYDAHPTLELTQSLWGNGFGRATRAGEEASEAQAVSMSLQTKYQVKQAFVGAEQVYWALALARKKIDVQKTTLSQAEKLYEWSTSRAKKHLADESDAFQAKANLDVRQLELQVAIDDERTAARAFNKLRNVDSDTAKESLVEVVGKQLLESEPPKRADKRLDVKAAEQQSKAIAASATAAIERNEPTLNLKAAYTLNGRDASLGPTLADPFSQNRPTYALGVNFSMPLDPGLIADVKGGYAMEQKAAELTYQQRLLNQEQEWKDLTQRLSETRKRLLLSQKLTEAQSIKLEHERRRLKEGRTTTFQVLLFEQDFSQAQLNELRSEFDILSTLTQMKTFGVDL